MKIWLLNPPYKEKVFREGRCEQKIGLFQTIYPPLTLATVASILRKKHNVHIIDCIGNNVDIKELIKLYIKEKPEKVFVSVSTPTIKEDIHVINTLNTIKRSKFLAFGVHASYFSKQLSKNSNIATIKGEPERYAMKLIGKKYDFRNLPFPAWDLVDLSNYRLPLKNKNFVLVKPIKGCPYKCTFCVTGFYYGKKVIIRPVEKIIKELKYIRDLGFKDILFYADTFTINREWCKELCEGIIGEKLNISWICNSRVDTVDYEMLKIMKKAGLWLISFGIESGDQVILNKAKKGITISQIYSAVKHANSLNILTFGHFIFGLPGETEQTIKKTIYLAKSLKLDFAVFYIATPFPGSKLYEKYKNLNIDWNKCEYSTQVIPTKLNLVNWQKKAMKAFYFAHLSRRLIKIIKVLGIKSSFSIFSSGLKTWFNIIKK